MNKYFSILMLSSVMLLASCVSDDSNDSVNTLNEAVISGIADVYDNVYVDDRLSISPTVVSSTGNPDAFSYFRITYDKQTY